MHLHWIINDFTVATFFVYNIQAANDKNRNTTEIKMYNFDLVYTIIILVHTTILCTEFQSI